MHVVNTKYKNLFQDELFPEPGPPEQCTGEKVNLLDDDELLMRAVQSDECCEGVATTEADFVAAYDVNTLTDPLLLWMKCSRQ